MLVVVLSNPLAEDVLAVWLGCAAGLNGQWNGTVSTGTTQDQQALAQVGGRFGMGRAGLEEPALGSDSGAEERPGIVLYAARPVATVTAPVTICIARVHVVQ